MPLRGTYIILHIRYIVYLLGFDLGTSYHQIEKGNIAMFITILKNSHKNSFALMDTKRNCFGIHVSSNHDPIKVYQWANDEFKYMKSLKPQEQYVLSVYGGVCNG